ncbi:MAG: TIGR00645 family protein, partial [Rhodospirillaceae bacterium]
VVQVLGVVDIVLVMNLVLMVIFVGYVNFVSKIHFHQSEDKPEWLDKLSYSGLKVQMMGSILAISSVRMLRAFFSLGSPDSLGAKDLIWLVSIYGAFVIALLCVAVTNKLQGHSE